MQSVTEVMINIAEMKHQMDGVYMAMQWCSNTVYEIWSLVNRCWEKIDCFLREGKHVELVAYYMLLNVCCNRLTIYGTEIYERE